MNAEQKQLLEAEYQRSANWSTATISGLARRLGLSHTKVYKWNWERKKNDLR